MFKGIGVGWSKGNQLKETLEERILLVQIETRMGAKGRLAKFLLVTFEGFELLGIEGPPGRGGVIHRYVAQIVMNGAKIKGWKVEVEKDLGNGGVCDAHLEKDDRRIGVEIAVVSKTIEGEANLIHDGKRTPP